MVSSIPPIAEPAKARRFRSKKKTLTGNRLSRAADIHHPVSVLFNLAGPIEDVTNG